MQRHKKGLQVNECLNVQGSNSMRTLIAASLAALSMNGVYASDLAPVPQTATNDNNQTSNLAPVPSTEKGSAYTLTKVSEGGEKPEGDNIVTKFTYNAETKVMTPVYYRLTLNKTAYGEGDTPKYYGWTKSDDGNRTFGEVSQADADLTYSYNTPSSSLEHIDYDKSPAVDAVTGDFVGQTAASGGAIHNVATNIGTITGNFINNSASNDGGAISHAESSSGGGRIDTIQGNFIGNNVQYNGRYSSSYGYGGAIYSIDDIGSIKGDFVGNYVQSNQSGMGGAIANVYIGYYGSIGGITGDFIGNYVSAERAAYGGAIANSSISSSMKPSIGGITGDFTGNYTVSTNSMASGGAIYNENGTIGFVNGNFIGNYAQGSYAYGGAISNNENATISGVSGDFIGNYAAASGEANGGAIYNTGTLLGYDVPNDKVIGLVSATYINSDTGESFTVYYLQSGDSVIPAEDLSEALSMGYKVTNIGNEKAEVGNEAYQQMLSEVDAMVSSGVVFRDDPTQGLDSDVFAQPIGITGDFIGNYAKSDNSNAKGGAIYNTSSSSNINKIEGDFISNYVSAEGNAFGGAIANDIGRVDTGSNMTVHSITNIKGDFINNHAESVSGNAQGGAIYNASGYGVYYSTIIGEIGNIQGNFIGNYAKSTDGDASGGAIYNNGNINSIENSSFINNYAVSQNGTAKGGAIYTTSDLTLGATDEQSM